MSNNCVYNGCLTRSSYGYEANKALYCNKHKLDGMHNVIDKTCIYGGCLVRSTFGNETGKAMYCYKHRLDV